MNTYTSQNEFAEVPMYTVELTRDRSIPFKSLESRAACVEVLHTLLDKSPVERFIALYLDINDKLVGAETISIGQLTRVEVPIRELFRGAIVAGVSRVILAHNHPISGNAYPSTQDLMVTGLAVNIGNVLGIRVLDHIVVAPNGTHYSIMDEKNLEEVTGRIDLHFLDKALLALGSTHPIAKRTPAF